MKANKPLSYKTAMSALDVVIRKSRIHLYKPIQIAEILYRDRVVGDIDLENLATYRIESKKWRDDVTRILVGSVSTSSAKFQDNLFEGNALPPALIAKLGERNRATEGDVEKYIYDQFRHRFDDINFISDYASNTLPEQFSLSYFLDNIEAKAGLRRSVDKIYEILVYSLFETLIEAMQINVSVSVGDPHNPIFSEFRGFSDKIFGADFPNSYSEQPAKLFRVGVTNAADRGLDMWGNFGLAIQIKHITISKEVAESVAETISADRIVIVCKDAEERIILSIIQQLGWKGRIQSIITLSELDDWYGKAMRGKFADLLGKAILDRLVAQIRLEFPATSGNAAARTFFEERGY